ncbi:hypothetical protein [Metabacillus fastidiosus]|uniref:Uncharacterized protein n=1 Tax=Metabacillus fastidiosus TaxID=1458 RepID=A0ABU6NXF0_9BACI|nr:hypothetical protein [Metabacillus fastidiosus]MED4401323.1 hypothetical protein [Metabacillus fastidiosus]
MDTQNECPLEGARCTTEGGYLLYVLNVQLNWTKDDFEKQKSKKER